MCCIGVIYLDMACCIRGYKNSIPSRGPINGTIYVARRTDNNID